MKVVVNANWGGFGLGVSEQYRDFIREFKMGKAEQRADPRLVAFVENHPNECGDLVVIIVPDEAELSHIDDDDGFECIYYLLNGHWECMDYEGDD